MQRMQVWSLSSLVGEDPTMPRGSYAHVPQLQNPQAWSLCFETREATAMRSLCTATKSRPCAARIQKSGNCPNVSYLSQSQISSHLYSLCFKMNPEEMRTNIHNYHRYVIIQTELGNSGVCCLAKCREDCQNTSMITGILKVRGGGLLRFWGRIFLIMIQDKDFFFFPPDVELRYLQRVQGSLVHRIGWKSGSVSP